jgi:hypothetical protein
VITMKNISVELIIFHLAMYVIYTPAVPRLVGQGTSVICRRPQFEPLREGICSRRLCAFSACCKKISSSIPRQSTGLRPTSSHECCDAAVYGWGGGSKIFSIYVRRNLITLYLMVRKVITLFVWLHYGNTIRLQWRRVSSLYNKLV